MAGSKSPSRRSREPRSRTMLLKKYAEFVKAADANTK
jgi:hypothetical protein